jgi:glycine dehydrogenase
MGIRQLNSFYFDTLCVDAGHLNNLRKEAESKKINLRYFTNGEVGISMDETTNDADITLLTEVFAAAAGKKWTGSSASKDVLQIQENLQRQSSYLLHPVFHAHRSDALHQTTGKQRSFAEYKHDQFRQLYHETECRY